jgi:hypothetical protein
MCCIIKVFSESVGLVIVSEGGLCSLYLVEKQRSVCPTYALLQSGQVSLCAPDRQYRS